MRPTVSDRAVLIAALLLLPHVCPHSAAESENPDRERQQRLSFMKRKLDEFILTAESEPARPLPRTAEPVLRFSNPVRNAFSDGAVFLWLSGKRPVAAASLFIRHNGDFGSN